MINLHRSMRLLLPFLTAVVLGAADNTRLELEPARSSPAKGKHVVLLSGDEEYRSEEALPMLAKILSQSHGFKTTVLFALDADGTINPNNPHSLPGAEALDSADVIIMSLRFRAWSDEAMKHFVAAHQRGVPIIALRTSTHAFNFPAGSPWFDYTWNNKTTSPGGFGKRVLGETWVSHWGKHKFEATRGVIEPASAADPLFNGVTSLFGTTDVYEAAPPSDAKILDPPIGIKGLIKQASGIFDKFKIRSIQLSEGLLIFALHHHLSLRLQGAQAKRMHILEPDFLSIIFLQGNPRLAALGMRHAIRTALIARMLRQFCRTGARG